MSVPSYAPVGRLGLPPPWSDRSGRPDPNWMPAASPQGRPSLRFYYRSLSRLDARHDDHVIPHADAPRCCRPRGTL